MDANSNGIMLSVKRLRATCSGAPKPSAAERSRPNVRLERLSAKQKREIKSDIKSQLLVETPPAQRAYGVFWNLNGKRIHLQITSMGVVETCR